MTRNSHALSAFVDSITEESAVDPAVDPAVDTTAWVRVEQKKNVYEGLALILRDDMLVIPELPPIRSPIV